MPLISRIAVWLCSSPGPWSAQSDRTTRSGGSAPWPGALLLLPIQSGGYARQPSFRQFPRRTHALGFGLVPASQRGFGAVATPNASYAFIAPRPPASWRLRGCWYGIHPTWLASGCNSRSVAASGHYHCAPCHPTRGAVEMRSVTSRPVNPGCLIKPAFPDT